MSSRRNDLTRIAARLFAEQGYHGTSTADLAEAMGVQKGSLYAHIESKADLLWEVAREGAEAFQAALDGVPDDGPTRLALSAANWPYTWLRPGADTDELADRFTAVLLDGMRGYATPAPR